MIIKPTILSGVQVLEHTVFNDHRGKFSRIFCQKDLESSLKGREIKQLNKSLNYEIGTIRGLHYQNPPGAELKIIQCFSGKIFDVAVDLRKGSPSFLRWIGVELSAEKNNALLIPEGCAHGFQVLESNSELLYLHTAFYNPGAEGTVRFDDPAVGVSWPLQPANVSQRDMGAVFIDQSFAGITI